MFARHAETDVGMDEPLAAAEPGGPKLSRLETPLEWRDLELPPATKKAVDAIGKLALRPGGEGLAALFHGPAGTGKSLAAALLGKALGRHVLAVDLPAVVSKFIGETEKNIDRIFAAAEAAGAILVFDEADALFGKRTEVKDAHDRYINAEAVYLLQRLERFRGLAIFATRHGENIDPAFVRRLRFAVDFPPR
jgi:SpoVK/Ycf46/Vps4 family AAA+-type ATPase